MPRFESFTSEGWQANGIATIIVTRTQDHGSVEAGVFLVDLLCLGVKDAFIVERSAIDWPSTLDQICPRSTRVAVHPACMRKLVEGAVAYAESLGFSPHRDYKKTRRIFGSVDARDCPETFTFGQNGKPLYVAGPNDDQERIDRVIRTLTAKLGKEGFHYVVPAIPGDLGGLGEDFDDSDEPDVSDESLDERLRTFLAKWGRASDFHVVGGMCAAGAVCPNEVEIETLIDLFWGGHPPTGWGERQRDQLGELLCVYWNETVDRIIVAGQSKKAETIPHFADQPWRDDDELRDRATAWCRGFMRVVRTQPAAWRPTSDNPALQPYFDVIEGVSRDFELFTGSKKIPVGEIPRIIGVALCSLHDALPTDDAPPGAGN